MKKIITRSLVCASLMAGMSQVAAANDVVAREDSFSKGHPVINIDGRGNRLAAMVYGPGKDVYIVAGVNKIEEDFDKALFRARNTAAVQNIARFAGSQPCQSEKGGGKCYDCRAKDRCCNGLLVLWGKMFDMQKLEVVLIEEELGL